MIVGVPLLEGRVAPRCTQATQLMLVTVSRGRVTSRRVVDAGIDTVILLLELLRTYGIGTLVCGGITPDTRALVQGDGIDIVENVACSAAEVVAAIDTGILTRGFGFEVKARERAERLEAIRKALERYAAEDEQRPVNCLACTDRVCIAGLPCPQIGRSQPPVLTEEMRHTLDAASDIAMDQDPQLCRIAELVYLCLEMEYRRVGLAFCIDLLEPTRIVDGVLRRFVEVVPVCCKINHRSAAGGSSIEDTPQGDLAGWSCNPLQQASVLNAAETDLNVLIGLCIGADAVFTSASTAPVTALFVKDRSLANNPIGAVYSEYYLNESVALPRTHGMRTRQARSGGRRGARGLAREEK